MNDVPERRTQASVYPDMWADPVDDPRPEIIAAAAMGALRHSIRRWAKGRGRVELPVLVAQAFDAFTDVSIAAVA